MGAPLLDTEWAAELPDRFIACRDMGHAWRYAGARLTAEHSYERTLRCERCTTTRTQSLSIYGAILTGAYDYPDGYLAPSSTGRMSSDDRARLRLEAITRHTGDTDHA